MSLRLPERYSQPSSDNSGINPLDYEIAAEKAASLGRAGQMVGISLARLNAFEGAPADRVPLLKDAADAVWAYFIQRELCGLRRHDDAIQTYGIPREVLVRLGAR